MDHDPAKPPDSPAGDVPDPSPQRRRRARRRFSRKTWLGAGAALLLLVGAGLWVARPWHRPGPASPTESPNAHANRPEDPRLGYAGPFLNIHPDVGYVGDEKCSECHRNKALSYRRHPMGRSLIPVSQIAAQQRYDATAHNPFEGLGTWFLVERQGERVVHRQIGRDEKGQPVYESDMPVDYVIGSGARGHSYLTDRDGYLFQTPISWYSQKQIWDTSPGFGPEARTGRPIPGLCLFCHANRVRPREGYVNRYEQPVFDGYAIGCERCHGPGGRHVQDPGRKDPSTGVDYTIVNPHHLEPELRAAVCEQCHLTGEARVVHRGQGLYDFRPGLPLEAFWSIFVRATETDEERKAVSHVEQMYASRCFLRSEESPAQGRRKLGCTSCHDPHQHVGPEERVAHYRSRCLECHSVERIAKPPSERGCSVPEATRRLTSKEDSCIDCHMPRYPPADIAHTTTTDHRIIRGADKAALSRGEKGRGEGRPKREPGIVSFFQDRLDPDTNPKRQRGDATSPKRQQEDKTSPKRQRGDDTSPKRQRGDLDSEDERDLGIALAHILVQSAMQRKAPPARADAQAVAFLDAAVQNDPDDLQAGEAKAEVLAILGRHAEALAAYETVLAKAPHREASLLGAAMLAQGLQQTERALAYWRRAVAENPWQPSYQASLAQMLADQKAWDEARTPCEAWLRLDPASIDARVLWVRCLIKTGDKAAARAEFAKIERLRPPNLPRLQARFTVELRSR
jgi:Tfp pilus assembly protein PilF